METLFTHPVSPTQPELDFDAPLSVSDLTNQLRQTVENRFQRVAVLGEVSNLKRASSGHLYFSLKDENASLNVAWFGGARQVSSQLLKDGLEVVAKGKISIYGPRGSYQLIAREVLPLGEGALQVAFEQLKKKLQAQGWFDASRKRSLPSFPSRIFVVSSRSGAAIQDVFSVLGRLAPQIQIRLVPSLVQGASAEEDLIRAFDYIETQDWGELVLLTRGGGSLEDLWCFNGEKLAARIAQCPLPVISAVGHEVDTTISDWVADLRAPTPSAAAEMIAVRWADGDLQLKSLWERLNFQISRQLGLCSESVDHLMFRLKSPAERVQAQVSLCSTLAFRLIASTEARFKTRSHEVSILARQLDAYSPLSVLKRGYSIVSDLRDRHLVIKSSQDVVPGKELCLRFHDGETSVRAI